MASNNVLKRGDATADIALPIVGGEAVITQQSVGWHVFSFSIHIVQCDADFTVEVLGPSGVYAPYPKVDTASTVGGVANGLYVVVGRWEGIKIKAASGTVYVRGDLRYGAYQR